jgi:hypothetical protein
MRTISANALAEITKTHGAEPVNIVEIRWVEGGSWHIYADKTIPGVAAGRILDFSAVDSIVSVTSGSDSNQISLTIDDSDETIKHIFDQHDVHKRDVRVYQWFEGLDLSDKFLLFRGQINSPIVWNEGARTFSLDVVTRVEEKEVGFSAEEGQFPQIPDSLIGKPWPLAFGTVLDLPALRIAKSITGTTQQGVGIISGTDLHKKVHLVDDADLQDVGPQLAQLNTQSSLLAQVATDWLGVDDSVADRLRSQINAITHQMSVILAQAALSSQVAQERRTQDVERFNDPVNIGPSEINILGGEDFPQGIPVQVDINGGLFTGVFDCQTFRITSRRHPDNEARAQELFDQSTGGIETSQTGLQTLFEQSLLGNNIIDMEMQSPRHINPPRHIQTIVITNPPTQRRTNVTQVAQHFWADAGSQVRLISDLPETHIVSIVPGTVLAVKAYKQFEGIRRLINVPNELWSQVTENFGPITAETVRLTKQLSSIPDQGWEDNLYVTFESSVGPNTVDVMEYLIDTYSNLSKDTTSFDAVKTKLTPFPSSFAVLDRPQILELLRKIAFQCRCALFIKDDTVHLKYLPEEPAADDTITESDVAAQSISVTLTPTEDLVTKMDVTWRPTYADDDERKMILRHNVAKYGDQAEEFDWFIYNQPDIIRKAATFWLIRKSNTWKRIKFKTFLNMLRLETFDTVLLDFNRTFVADNDVKAIVEQAVYDSESNSIDFECLVPVKAGQMSPYKFFWPAAAEGTFPLPDDFPGGDNVGEGATGDLPVSSLNLPSPCSSKIFIGGPNIVFVGPADHGDPTPQDTGFVAQPLIPAGTNFNLIASPRPNVDLTLTYAPRIPRPVIPPLPVIPVIDITKTWVVDTQSGNNQFALLSTILREINSEGKLVIDTDALWGDGTDEKEFDFRFDVEGDQWGAGTAFLKSDE